ncbi:MAG: hypothetical protein P8172_09640 [Gammaproteobacteria bacterium]
MTTRGDGAGGDAALAAALRELPGTAPPRGAWEAIRRRGEAEGLLVKRPARRLRRDLEWLVGGALAATVVIALLNLTPTPTGPDPVAPAIDETQFAATPDSPTLDHLIERSRMLERALRAAPGTPRVMRASTANTIATLEDRVALIDQQLSFPERPLTDEEVKVLWRERVQLMDSLVQLRYAQARRVVL